MKIKFLTLNILHGGELFDQIVDFIGREDPDIMTLQEVQDTKDESLHERNYHTLDHLSAAFPQYSHVFEPEFSTTIKGGKILHGNATLSKHPIKSHDTTFFRIPFGDINFADLKARRAFHLSPHNLLHTSIAVDGRELNVFNIHGIWGTDGDDSESRLAMADTVLDALEGKEDIILAGDFNLQPNTRTIAKIEAKLTNVFKDELTSTFNMDLKTEPGYATAVVDMIFVSPSIRIKRHYMPPVKISDHMPLIAELEI